MQRKNISFKRAVWKAFEKEECTKKGAKENLKEVEAKKKVLKKKNRIGEKF